MKLNKKGMTMMEIIVSIALISIVLVFLMNLFLKVRETYMQSKIQANYDMLVANIIKAVGNDIDTYGLRSVEYETPGKKDAIILTFNTFRPYHLSERIKKVLRIYFRNNTYYISYAYEAEYTDNINSNERVTSIVREIPPDVVIDSSNYIELESKNINPDKIVEIKIPMSNARGSVYDINIYGIIEPEITRDAE